MSDLSKAQAQQRIVNAYHRLFNGPDGKAVLEDLRKSFGTEQPAFIPQTRGRHCEYDPLHAAIRDGQRQILLHIEARLKATAKGDANIESAPIKVKL